ncbi:trypsin-like peptidase domain-containing protein [Streptomyces sp. NPDC059875]|uniref:trypsin-like peptidase domain-containing protein n=1 Tax=unclassified Streptomyces TaxID=2593676 RepID=UPI003651FEED
MKFERVVQVHGSDDGAGGSFGTGWLIGPGLVLTAAHLLRTDKGRLRPAAVEFPWATGAGRRRAATVVWIRYDDIVDAALLAVAEPDGHDLGAPLRWGDLVTARPAHPVESYGFPRLQAVPAAGRRHEEHLTGRISPGTVGSARRWELLSDDPLPAGDGAGAGWAGMSGAPVFSGDLLLGVIRRDRRAPAGSRLVATRACELLADESFRTALRGRSPAGPEPVAEPAELAPLLEPTVPERDLRSPAMLLRADVEATPFRGRQSEWRQLLDWCLGPSGARGPNLTVRVLTGPGGQGKSRLARRLAAAVMKEPGWAGGLLRADLGDETWQGAGAGSATDEGLAVIGACTRNLFLVVDYAESRPRWIRRLIEQARKVAAAGRTVRILLVARSSGGWQLDPYDTSAATHEILASALTYELGPLDVTAEDRRAAFDAALHGLAGLLGRTEGHEGHDWGAVADRVEAPADLTGSRYATALNVQMEALAALLQAGPEPLVPEPGEAVEATLLRHEERYWARAFAARGEQPLPMPLLRRIVAAATLCGAADEDEAMAVVSRVPGLGPVRAWELAESIRRLYPAAHDAYWGMLQPDRVGEFQASRVVGEVPGLLPALIAGATAAQQVQAMTVLTRAVVAHANGGRTGQRDVVLGRLGALVDGPLLGVDVLRTCAAALPPSSDALARFAVRLTDRLVRRYREGVGEEDGLAWALGQLAERRDAVGDWRAALKAAEEAVALRRAEPRAGSIAYERRLAEVLVPLATLYWRLEQWREALTLAEEAVRLSRHVAEAEPEVGQEPLAKALLLLARTYQDAARPEESVPLASEAVRIRRTLADGDPAREPFWASALRVLANSQTLMGATAEGSATAERALTVERRLARENPDAHLASLAGALHALSYHYWRAGADEVKSKAASEESVRLRRRLAVGNPDTYGHGLAGALVNLAASQPDEEALRTLDEALAIHAELDDPPLVSGGSLRLLHSNQAYCLWQLSRTDEAIEAVTNAVALGRMLYADNAALYGERHANDLEKLARYLHDSSRRTQEAIDAIRDCVEVRRFLAAAQPSAAEADLAFACYLLGWYLNEAERRREAEESVREALERYAPCWTVAPDLVASDYATCLGLAATIKESEGRYGDARADRERAVEILRAAARRSPEMRGSLAWHLWASAESAFTEGGMRQYLRGLPAAREATEIYALLADSRRPRPDANLQGAASMWVMLLTACGRWTEAAELRHRYGLHGF